MIFRHIKRSSTSVMLIALSIALLILLQVFWLRTEYRSARDSFSRETTMIFRQTLYQLTDSLFFSEFKELRIGDTVVDLTETGARYSHSLRSHNIRDVAIIDLSGKDEKRHENDTSETKRSKITFSLLDPESFDDTLHLSKNIKTPGGVSRWSFGESDYDVDYDIIAKYYKGNLGEDYRSLSFDITEQEFDPRASRQLWRSQSENSQPFQTNYIPFAGKLYAAEFQHAGFYLFQKMLPQTGFALLTLALIVLSFILVYRNLNIQKRLLEHKDNFISNVTHELKTPVASVGVALEALEKFDVLKDTEKAREYIELASHELNRLSMMTEKILKTSIHDFNEDIRYNKTTLFLDEIAEEVLSSFRIIAKHNDIKLDIEKSGETKISGNREHITQMIYNLVDNAFKYASEGKIVKIIIKENEQDVSLAVEDNGPGISQEHKHKIFEKFYRVPTGNIHNVKGYGLGLHYVEGVAKAHGGKVLVENVPDGGCRFVVEMPGSENIENSK